MNKNLKTYYETAKKLKLAVTYLNTMQCLRIRLGKKNYYFMGPITPMNSSSSMFIAKNKHRLLQLLKKSGFPVPNHIAVSKESNWQELLPPHLEDLKFPVVIKPTLDTHSGEGVVCSIKTPDQLFDYLQKNFEIYSHLQIEEFHQGLKEYRVLILKNRIIAVAERRAAQIVGDGKSTIEELIARKLTITYAIKVNAECLICLGDQGLSLESVVPAGKIIRLHYPVNRSLGGTCISLGKKMLAENANYLGQAARITGLDLVGIDLLCEDINLPFSETKWIIIEANLGPAINAHELPDEGKPMKVSKQILRQLIFQHPFAYMFHRFNLFLKKLYG
jgi:cyanophycin synthetase